MVGFLLSYFAGPKSVSVRPSDPDTMTNTALEAIASLSGKKARCQYVNHRPRKHSSHVHGTDGLVLQLLLSATNCVNSFSHCGGSLRRLSVRILSLLRISETVFVWRLGMGQYCFFFRKRQDISKQFPIGYRYFFANSHVENGIMLGAYSAKWKQTSSVSFVDLIIDVKKKLLNNNFKKNVKNGKNE